MNNKLKIVGGLLRNPRSFLTSSTYSSVASPSQNSNLNRKDGQRDLTNMDLLEEKIRQRAEIREFTIGGQKQRWAYRSEVVNKLGLDNNHRNIWVAYGLIIIFGFTAFVYVKSTVVMNRKEEMEERERIRKELNLTGVDRKKIAVVDN